MAIVQSDILHRAKDAGPEDNLQQFSDKIGDIRSLLSLFPEYIQIVVRKDSAIRSLLKLHGKRLYIGLPDSGTRYNAEDLLHVLGINGQQFTEVTYIEDVRSKLNQPDLAEEISRILGPEQQALSTTIALKLLKAGHLDAVFSTSGKLIGSPDLRHLPFNNKLAPVLRQQFEYYGLTPVEIPGEGTIPLLFTRANLVARSPESVQGLSDSDAELIVRKIHENQLGLEKLVSYNLDFFFGDRMVRRMTHNIHPGAETYFRSRNMLPHVSPWEYVISALLVFVGLTIFFAKAARNTKFVVWLVQTRLVISLYSEQSWFKRIWDEYLKITCETAPRIWSWFFAITAVAVIYSIRLIEKTHSIANDVENPFAGTGFLDGAVWLLTFAITGFNQDIYPNTPLAKFLAVLVPVLGIVLTLYILITKTYSADREKERQAQGISIPRFKNHIVICGWNDRVPNLLRDLVSVASPLPAGGKVVVIADHDTDKPLEGLGLEGKRVAYVRGRSSDYEILKKVRIEHAIGAIVVAGQKKIVDNNYRSILTCTAIRESLRSLPKERMPKGEFYPDDFPIIAELYYEENRQFFESSEVNKLVSLKSVSVRLISHAALNPGISRLLIELMTFSTSQVAKMIKATEPEQWKKPIQVVGRTISEALEALRKSDVLLLSAYENNQQGLQETKSHDIDFVKNSPYHFGSEMDYEIKETDLLLVVRRNKKTVGGGKKFLRDHTSISFDYANEVVLLIGNNWAGEEIAEVLSKHAKKVIRLVLQSKEDESNNGENREIVEEHNNITILRTNQQIDTQFYANNRGSLSGVTRAVILGPNRKTPKDTEAMSEIFQDDQTIMHAKVLRRIAKDNKDFADNKHFHILAEMRCDDNLELFHHSGIDQPVPTNKLIEQCLAQMVFNRGVLSEFFLNAMSYSDDNRKGRLERMSAMTLAKRIETEVVGANYDELLGRCSRKGVQFVAIQPVNDSGIEGSVILNPADSHGKSHRLGRGDYVFVIVKPDDTGAAGREAVKGNLLVGKEVQSHDDIQSSDTNTHKDS
ncbi:MAG: NAD-binding protein [Chromatiales bacterium]|nr:NAD-binding protein [Gammaproteobacteria bacterium]